MTAQLLKERIFQYRQARHLSQEELAHIIGVSWHTLQRWETGHTTPRGLHKRTIERILAKGEAK